LFRVRWASNVYSDSKKEGKSEKTSKSSNSEDGEIDNSPAVSVFVSFHAKSPDISITDETIRQDFAQFGDIIDVAIRMILKDKYYHFHKGYAFVSFPDNSDGMESAIKAIQEMNNIEYNGILYKCEPSRRLGQRLGLAEPPRHQRGHHQQQQQLYHQQQRQQFPSNRQAYGHSAGTSTSASPHLQRSSPQQNQQNQQSQNTFQQQRQPQQQYPQQHQQPVPQPNSIPMFPSSVAFSPPSQGQAFFPPSMMRYPDGQVMPGQLVSPAEWQVNSQFYQQPFPLMTSSQVQQNQASQFALSSSTPPYPSYGMSHQSTNFVPYGPPNPNFVHAPSYPQQMISQVPHHLVPSPQGHSPSDPRMQHQNQSTMGYKPQPPRYN
jgi:RNA recognition motif-containing protein